MSATSGGGGSVSEGSEAGGSSSTMSVSDSPSTSFQTNLPENVTKITLSEEAGVDYGADVTGSKMNLSLDERQQKDGIVNVAFDYEEGTNRGGGGVVGAGGNDFRSSTGSDKKDKVPEAVNLELVNMVPYSNGNGTSYGVPVNGIPMKKDSEQVDMSTPYDEYFVPVNEHKKYMRGEKLYVTKDKRRPTSWRRCLSWIVACTVISVVLIVGILAGTGVILSQEPNLVKEASVGRNFGGSNLKPVTNKSPTPTAEMYMYVPRSIESEFVIDNLDFDPAFKDANSTAYQHFVTTMENQLKMLLFDKETPEFGESNVELRVVNISRDPFKVNYRIGWNYKQGVTNPPEPIKMEDVKKRLVESLARNQGYIDKYHIDKEAIKVNHVINTCQMDNGGCSHICYYNYITQQFTCTCPTHLVLDNSGENCVAWAGPSEDDALSVPSHTAYPGMPYVSTASSLQEKEFGVHYEHGSHQYPNFHDHSVPSSELESTADGEYEPAPEPTVVPSPDRKDGTKHDYHYHDQENSSEFKPKPNTEDKYAVHSVSSEIEEPSAEPTSEPTPKPTIEDKNSSGHLMHDFKEGEPSAEPTPEPAPNQDSEKRSHDHDGHTLYGFKDHEPSAEPTPEPTTELISEGKDHDHHFISGSKDHEPVTVPQPESSSEPAAKSSTDRKSEDQNYTGHSVYVSNGREINSEPTAEPTSEPAAKEVSDIKILGHESHSVGGLGKDEPTAEPTLERSPQPHAKEGSATDSHDREGNSVYVLSEKIAEKNLKDHESATQLTPEQSSERTEESDSNKKEHDSAVHNFYEYKDKEPTPEPSPESTADSTGKNSDSAVHYLPGHKDEEPTPKPEPTEDSDLNKKDNDFVVHLLYGHQDEEPTAEPSPEPTADFDSTDKNSGSAVHHLHGHKDEEPTPKLESTGDSDFSKKQHDSVVYRLFKQKDEEPTAEPTSEPVGEFDSTKKDHDFFNGRKNEEPPPKPELIADSGFTKQDHDPARHAYENHSVAGNSEPVTELTIEPSASDTDSRDGKHGETILHSLPSQEHTNTGQSEQTQKTESQMEYAATFHPSIQIESDKKNKSLHHVPYLEDVLIRQYSSDSENKAAQNPLDNVELTADGKPVIEELIITGKKSTTQPDTTVTPPQSELDSNLTINPAGSFNNDSPALSSAISYSSVKGLAVPAENETNLDTQREITQTEKEMSTDHPKIVEYSSKKFFDFQSKGNGTESEKSGLETIETSDSGTEAKNNDSTQSENKGVIQGQNTMIPLQENVKITTIRTEIQHEYHTIPVMVESSNPVHANTESEPKQKENQTSVNVEQTRKFETDPNSTLLNAKRPTILETDLVVDLNSTAGAPKQAVHETPTEPQADTTTVLSILTPDELAKVTGQLNKDMTAAENKTVDVRQSQQENNETTKSPEEISNNIKDEIIENEEFNTLINKEYNNKNGSPTEISKYPNKSLKTEKKKIKDFFKGEKTAEVTVKPDAIPEDFILQKHVNGNEHVFDLDYSLQNEHTTKHDGEITVTDPHGIHVVPGVSLKPFGINNHDISVLQTVAPDFRTETVFPIGGQEFETLKPDSKTKISDTKEGEAKAEKDFVKFDKDYKYEKQKVSKKKELKKKVSGKDGKNVELEDGRKYFTEITKDDLDLSHEHGKSVPETTIPETFGMEINSTGRGKDDNSKVTANEVGVNVTEHPVFKTTNEQTSPEQTTVIYVDQKGHMMVDEPLVKSTSRITPMLVHDGNSNPEIKYRVINTTEGVGTVYDGISHGLENSTQPEEKTTFVFYENDHTLSSGSTNSTTAHPTIIIHGQSGNLQDGYKLRFNNTMFLNPGNATFLFNDTHPSGHFSFTNYTATFPNGSAVHPTIFIRGQSGALQDGYETRFGNSTFVTPFTYKTKNVYRIENETVPGTVFDGHFNPKNGYYHMFTNASGTFVYTNTTHPPFVMQSSEFGNATGPIEADNTNGFSIDPQSVVFRNSSVFAVDSGVRGSTVSPYDVKNETIHFTHQISPSFVSSGTAYKVNDYFGYISKCAAGQFQCVNGTSKRGSACINLSSKCDSIPDCSDGSDELGCIENGCPGNFQCSDGTCLKRNLVCNGILDCSDASDEKNCESWKCEFDEFQCPSGRCIPIVWQCDSKPDCDNHTDEYHCQTSCGNDEYLCPEGWCIPLTYKCNGIKECSNGEDEQLCDCSHEEFKCQTGGCVSTKQVCNGVDDCPDRSDEWDCVKLEPSTNLLKIRSPSGVYAPVCADSWLPRYSDEVCTSLGFFSSIPNDNENNSSIATESSFFILKNDTTADFNSKIIVNLRKGEGDCSSGKMVEISCQEFSCGSRSMTESSSVEARLVGGMSATTGQWPSVALLYNIRNLHSCTANVLTPRWVLASYNCLKVGNKNLNEQDWKFFGGSTVFEGDKENAETQKIVSIVPHPQVKFNQFLFTNDLALVELSRSLQFTSSLGAVCLPKQEIQPRQICVTAGWGMDTPEDKAIRQQLQYLPVPTMNLTECNSTEHYSGFITDDKICAGYNSAQKSLCYNEEGAPLMCVNDRGEWELQGVLSYHSNCGRGSHPSIFSSITPVINWIKKTIGNSFERKALPVTKR